MEYSVWNLAVLILCIVGCFVQLSSITWTFFRFKIRTEITYNYPKEITYPEIDIVIPSIALMNLSQLYARHPNEMTLICQTIHSNFDLDIDSVDDFMQKCSQIKDSGIVAPSLLTSVITVGDVEQLTEDPREMIEGIFFDDLYDDLLKANICQIVRHFNGVGNFLRISCRDKAEPIKKKIDRDYMGENWLLCVKTNFHVDFGLRVSAPNSTITSRLNDYFFGWSKKGEFLFVLAEYNQFISESLPWPYESNCRNYDRILSLNNCINENLLARSIPGVFAHSILPFNAYPPHFKFIDKPKFARDDSFYKIREKCSKLYEQTECRFTSYHVHGKVYSEPNSKGGVVICLEPPHDPLILHKAYPASNLMDLIVYVSSVLGIWFGISVYEQLTARIRNGTKRSKHIVNKLIPQQSTATSDKMFESRVKSLQRNLNSDNKTLRIHYY